MIVLQVRGPVETFGEYLVWTPAGVSEFRTTEFPDCAKKFGSKSSARRFAKAHEHNLTGVFAVPVEVTP